MTPEEYDKHTWKTFKEWSDGGYLILKGSKATRIEGVYKFHEGQVTPKPRSGIEYDNSEDDLNDDPFGDDDWISPMDFGDN